MSNPITTSLPEYINQERLPLIAKAILKAKTAGLLSLQTGVKGKTALNLLDTEVVFGDAHECGFDAAGSATLSQRYLDPAYLKVNMEFCDKKLLGTWAQHQVKIAAGIKTLPFEEDFTSHIVDNVNAAIEKMIWQGDSDNGNEFDGFLKVLNGTAVSANRVTNTSTPVYDSIKAVYAALPETAIAEDTVIFVGAGDFRTFVQELVALNLYHYDANDAAGEIVLPGTAVKVISVNGLNGTDKIVAGRLSNMFYGVDLANDEEKFDLWYSKDNQVFRLAIEFMAGVQVAYPDQIVVA